MSKRVFHCDSGRLLDLEGVGSFVIGDPTDPAEVPGWAKWKAGGEFHFDSHDESERFKKAWLAYLGEKT